MRSRNKLTMAVLVLLAATHLAAQAPASDAAARLREVLPADIAARVLATIAAARTRELPTQALENRALKFAARGIPPTDIERAIREQADRMAAGRDLLQEARGKRPDGDEIDAAAEALRKGVDRARISDLAKAAPSGRSLAVPLYVIGSLIDRGLPSTDALKRVRDRLEARASDSDIEQMAGTMPAHEPPGQANKAADAARDIAEAKHPASSGGSAGNGSPGGGPPAGVPGNAGRGKSHKPPSPPGKKP